MTAFDKELEGKIKQLLALEQEEKNLDKKNHSQLISKEEEIKQLEKLAIAFEQGRARIDKKIRELKGIPTTDPTIYEEDLQKIIQQAVEIEIQKKYGELANEKEAKLVEKELILKNAIVKRKMKDSIASKNINRSGEHEKDQNIKDYKLLSVASTGKKEESFDKKNKDTVVAIDSKELQVKCKLLGSYWNVTHSNLIFTSAVIEDVAKTFTQKDFIDLEDALNQLNTNQEIKRKKINPDSEDYYLSFRVSSGVKSRIFYQMMPEASGQNKMVITRIVKQYHLRYVE